MCDLWFRKKKSDLLINVPIFSSSWPKQYKDLFFHISKPSKALRRDKKSPTDRSVQQSLQHGHLSRNPGLSIQSGQHRPSQGSQHTGQGQPRFHQHGAPPIFGQPQVGGYFPPNQAIRTPQHVQHGQYAAPQSVGPRNSLNVRMTSSRWCYPT